MSRGRQLPADARVVVEQVAADGFAEGHLDGFQLRIRGALEGEQVGVKVLRRKRRRLETQAQVVARPSAQRVPAPCPWAGRCGGCVLQHLAPEAQRQRKRDRLARLLMDAGAGAPERWLADTRGPELGYRHKARLGMRQVPGRELMIGFREPASSRVADVAACHVLAPAIGQRITELRQLLEQISCAGRLPQLEVACGEDAAALILRHLEPLTEADLELLRAHGARTGVHWYLQRAGPDSVHRLWPDTGPERLHYSHPAFGLRFAFHPLDFVQVNPGINRQMVALAVELLAPGADDTVLDLFCGLGNFTLPLATRAGRVIGIEGSAALTRRAQENVLLNAARLQERAPEFACADLYDAGFDPMTLPTAELMLLDPPRSGAEAIARCSDRLPARRVVYVSCDPTTLARDAAWFRQGGYRLAAAGILDMFPHTSHVESIAVFERMQQD